MNRENLVESIFYPIRVTGKSWTQISEIQNYCTEIISSSPEKRIPKNTILFGYPELNFNYPITLSFNPSPSFSDKYRLKKDLDVIVIDEQQIINKFKQLLKSYKFKIIQSSDIQIVFRDMGIKGYLSRDHLVIMNPYEYLF